VLDTTTEYDSEEHNIEAILLRDQVARQCSLVTELLDIVSGGNPDDYEAREAALQIVRLFLLLSTIVLLLALTLPHVTQTVLLEETEEIRDHFNKRHGMLIVTQALQIARSREILSILLRIVNLVCNSLACILFFFYELIRETSNPDRWVRSRRTRETRCKSGSSEGEGDVN